MAFWGTIYLKLLPLQLNGTGDGGEPLTKAVIEFVRPQGQPPDGN